MPREKFWLCPFPIKTVNKKSYHILEEKVVTSSALKTSCWWGLESSSHSHRCSMDLECLKRQGLKACFQLGSITTCGNRRGACWEVFWGVPLEVIQRLQLLSLPLFQFPPWGGPPCYTTSSWLSMLLYSWTVASKTGRRNKPYLFYKLIYLRYFLQ